MAKAFECDRCGELYRGEGINSEEFEQMAWYPSKHSYECAIVFSVGGFATINGIYLREGYIQFCNKCFEEIIELFLEKFRKGGSNG